jgi:hypothetical protein
MIDERAMKPMMMKEKPAGGMPIFLDRGKWDISFLLTTDY